MLNKIFSSIILFFITSTQILSAEIEYEIHDIGTLQTKSSQAIALNNQGQILGWYNIDGSITGKHFFVRNVDGSFYELPVKDPASGWEINWRYLTDDCKAYGTFDGNTNFAVLYMWDQQNDVVKLANLPGKEIAAINNAGQVLIKSVLENENGKSVRRPIIWQNGKITKLKGLCGDIGIESDESYGFDMNNKGEVVGQSLVYLSYKNELYKQMHAVKWTNGQAIDLHGMIPKTSISSARSINDLGDILIGPYLVSQEGKCSICNFTDSMTTDTKYIYSKMIVIDKQGLAQSNLITSGYTTSTKILNDINSIWMMFKEIISVNDAGEIIAQGVTIYGEEHAMFLSPVKSK